MQKQILVPKKILCQEKKYWGKKKDCFVSLPRGIFFASEKYSVSDNIG